MKSKFTYRGPLALYIAYYVLFALSFTLIVLSFRLDAGNALFMQLLGTGALAAFVSLSLILYSTQIERKINPSTWRKNADTYYNDEGVFDYKHNGFTIITKEGKTLDIRWGDIIRIESREDKMHDYMRRSCIDLYFSDKDFLTMDSTMPGFRLFEKTLKENMRKIWKSEQEYAERAAPQKKAVKI